MNKERMQSIKFHCMCTETDVCSIVITYASRAECKIFMFTIWNRLVTNPTKFINYLQHFSFNLINEIFRAGFVGYVRHPFLFHIFKRVWKQKIINISHHLLFSTLIRMQMHSKWIVGALFAFHFAKIHMYIDIPFCFSSTLQCTLCLQCI